MHELLRARYGQVPEARTHDRDGYGTCAGAPGARTAQHAPGLRPSAETNDLGWPDWPPDNGLKLADPDGLQIVLKIRGAGALDVEAPDRAAPARVPPAVNDRAMNLDGPRGGCQAGLVQLQVLVSGIADDQGDRDHALGHGIAPSWCAAARRSRHWVAIVHQLARHGRSRTLRAVVSQGVSYAGRKEASRGGRLFLGLPTGG